MQREGDGERKRGGKRDREKKERDKATWRDKDRQTDIGYVADFGPRLIDQRVQPFDIQVKYDAPPRQALTYWPMVCLWPRPSNSHSPIFTHHDPSCRAGRLRDVACESPDLLATPRAILGPFPVSEGSPWRSPGKSWPPWC